MKGIDLHARKLGDETPLLCTPLIGRTCERVLAEATSSIAQEPDMINQVLHSFAQHPPDMLVNRFRGQTGH